MNKSMFFLLGILTVLLVSGCTQTGQVVNVDVDDGSGVARECPASCDDGNECTADLCDENSDFTCRNVPRWGMECGENGICQDGVCVEMTDNCSHIMESAELEMCYLREYYVPAKTDKSVLKCDSIADDKYMARCYAYTGLDIDDPTLCEGLAEQAYMDECYAFYAKGKAALYIFAGDACDKIANAGMKADCMALEEIVIAPVGIKDFDAVTAKDGSGDIYSYFVLKDMKGRTTTAEGEVKVRILQADDDDEGFLTLFSETYTVSEDDYEMFSSGWGENEELSIEIDTIKFEDLEGFRPGNVGTFYLTFIPDGGIPFQKQKEIF